MNIRTAVTGLALLGMIGFVASTAEAQCSAGKSKASCSSKAGQSCKGTAGSKACCGSKASTQTCSSTAEECENWMRDHYKSHGWLGIEMSMDGPQPVVTKVMENSPAAAAGFKPGDLLTSINGIGFASGNDVAIQALMKNGFKVGDEVIYTAQRDREIVTLDATLAQIDNAMLDQMIATHLATPHKASEKAENLN